MTLIVETKRIMTSTSMHVLRSIAAGLRYKAPLVLLNPYDPQPHLSRLPIIAAPLPPHPQSQFERRKKKPEANTRLKSLPV